MTETTLIQPHESKKIAEVDKIESVHPSLADVLTNSKVDSASVAEPVSANCHTNFHAVHNSGTRPLSVIDLIVMHDTEGGSSQSVASYFASADSGGSAHLVVDDKSCYRCLDDNEVPWGAPGANYHGFHIEQCGYVTWTNALWSKTHRSTIQRAAYKAAFHCKRYGIKPQFLSATQLKAGYRNGITTHLECTKAFGGSHTDPGAGWPRILFMTLVRGYYATIDIKTVA